MLLTIFHIFTSTFNFSKMVCEIDLPFIWVFFSVVEAKKLCYLGQAGLRGSLA